MLSEFFHAPRGRMIDRYPRYAELLQKRDAGGGYTDQDFLDLQVWHKLAWVDPFYLDNDARVRRLVREAARLQRSRQGASCAGSSSRYSARVIPEYREAAERGQVELSTSPFYHPILPLLVRYRHLSAGPIRRASVPRPAFRRPEDAAEQLTRARQCHLRLFGREPAGLWPSEGSVSDDAAELAARAGFQWMATDEAILGRTIGREFRRDAQGRVEQPEPLYRPYAVQAGSQADRVSLPRSLALGFDWVRVRRLAGRGCRRRLRQPPRRGRPALFCSRAAGKRPRSRSFSTARTRGSTSKVAAAHSCGRSTARSRRIRSFDR